jgi:phage terminase large subunit-like protein
MPPAGDWRSWLVMTGRGWGKTRTAAEWLVFEAIRDPGSRSAIIAPTFDDVRSVCFEGDSGVLAVAERYGMVPDRAAQYMASRAILVLANGSHIRGFSGERPDRLRGPQHARIWGDEFAAWPRPEALAMARLGLRLGPAPRAVLTTTPRPLPHVRAMLAESRVALTRGHTNENAANLSPDFIAALNEQYGGSRLARQEMAGELLEDVEGALWTWALFRHEPTPADLVSVVVAIDPATTSGAASDETGIVVAGRDAAGVFHVIADRSGRYSPNGWAAIAASAAEHYGATIVAESNQGGEMVGAVLRAAGWNGRVKLVHASRGKATRAEPAVALYEQSRVVHAPAGMERLEDQMVSWVPGMPSPDRLDALVWALAGLDSRTLGRVRSFAT